MTYIFLKGIFITEKSSAVYKNMVHQRYKINASDAADALYEMMPESLKHYWWTEDGFTEKQAELPTVQSLLQSEPL